ncbi:uncharacterized protein LOC124869131 [Girardinichthys multiradiatus]|uniref:uncharacterized protein LOC124869131 n=1 Tax=Girardinichthys multiradiatus TaxID=208333 RepID=UPI001FAC336C|nr:uncharacterized protein LOC124869131 [Girardinichthys multiradiatus]XP_047222833.1 uncharacterized protein LOC124869131 [Girardinichthys multiradiatus]
MTKAGLYRTIRRVLDIDGWYLKATEYLECCRCKKKVGGWSQGIIGQLPLTYSCLFPAVLTYNCILGVNSGPANWPDTSRLVEAICSQLCRLHPAATRVRGIMRTRCSLIHADYVSVPETVLESPRLMAQTTIQLFELNQRTFSQWFNRRQKQWERSVLEQGVSIVPAPAVPKQPLLPAKELSLVRVGQGQTFCYNLPEEQQPGPFHSLLFAQIRHRSPSFPPPPLLSCLVLQLCPGPRHTGGGKRRRLLQLRGWFFPSRRGSSSCSSSSISVERATSPKDWTRETPGSAVCPTVPLLEGRVWRNGGRK